MKDGVGAESLKSRSYLVAYSCWIILSYLENSTRTPSLFDLINYWEQHLWLRTTLKLSRTLKYITCQMLLHRFDISYIFLFNMSSRDPAMRRRRRVQLPAAERIAASSQACVLPANTRHAVGTQQRPVLVLRPYSTTISCAT